MRGEASGLEARSSGHRPVTGGTSVTRVGASEHAAARPRSSSGERPRASQLPVHRQLCDVHREMADAVARVLASKNHYACLGLARDASERDLKLAYRSLSLALHPDKCTHPDAVTAFKRVSEAFGLLVVD